MASNIRAERIRAIRHGYELPQKRTTAVRLAEVWKRYDEWLETGNCLVLVRQLFNKAASWKMWSGANPVKEVKLPRLNNRRERFLTTEEADRLLEELTQVSRQLYEIAFSSLYTGMRAGEIFGLRWGHIDTKNSIILVADPKGCGSRSAFMSPEVKALFLEKESRSPDEFVFLDRKDCPLAPTCA
jgi:integrase